MRIGAINPVGLPRYGGPAPEARPFVVTPEKN